MPKAKKPPQVLVGQGNFVVDCYSENAGERVQKGFDTFDEAADYLFATIRDMGSRSSDLPAALLKTNKGIKIETRIYSFEKYLDEYHPKRKMPELTKEELKQLFQKHPCVPVTGEVVVFGESRGSVTAHFRGLKEIDHYVKTDPGMQSLQKILNRIGADGRTMSGITIKGKKK